jgi:hypothetical protein
VVAYVQSIAPRARRESRASKKNRVVTRLQQAISRATGKLRSNGRRAATKLHFSIKNCIDFENLLFVLAAAYSVVIMATACASIRV